MNRSVACISLFVLLVVLSFSVGIACADDEPVKNSIPKVSNIFTSAKDAVTFANSLGAYAASAQFLCEAHEGSPTYPAYVVLYYHQALTVDQEFSWQAKEGFRTLEAAKDFVNEKHALARYVSCRQHYGNLAESTITVFYVPDFLKDGGKYEILGSEWSTAEAVVASANANIGQGFPQFVPKFSSVSAATELWRCKWQMIALSTPGDVVYPPSSWRVARYSSLELAFQAVKNRNATVLDEQYVASFSVDGVQSSIVAFSLVQNEDKATQTEPAPLLTIPATVYATEKLRHRFDDAALNGIFEKAASVYKNFGVALALKKEVRTMPEVSSFDPRAWGDSVPRLQNELIIIFTEADLRIKNPQKLDEEYTVHGFSGRGWVLANFDPKAEEVAYLHTLLHELGHIFGADHIDDLNSVMCSDSGRACSKTSLDFDGVSLASVRDGIKAIKKIGLDTYTGLRTHWTQ